ncbi:MAG: hypothetical protein KBD28_00655 [Chitinophagaceae bacterium]|nr:hypothetical protein [Chitinophagaceae bacterium]
MTVNDIFEELDTLYNQQWFDDAEEKFYNHPSNKNKENSFLITFINEPNDNKILNKLITFEDFVLGARDEVTDSVNDEIEENKLEIIGELPNGYPDYKLPEDVQFNSSNEWYPIPSLGIWKKKMIAKIDRSLSLISNLAEKELFINSLDTIIKNYKDSFEVNNKRSAILSKQLNLLYSYISNIGEEISEINTLIEENTENIVLNFNLDQTDLARLIKLLIEKGILENSKKSDNLILKWFSRNATVKSNTAKR